MGVSEENRLGAKIKPLKEGGEEQLRESDAFLAAWLP